MLSSTCNVPFPWNVGAVDGLEADVWMLPSLDVCVADVASAVMPPANPNTPAGLSKKIPDPWFDTESDPPNIIPASPLLLPELSKINLSSTLRLATWACIVSPVTFKLPVIVTLPVKVALSTIPTWIWLSVIVVAISPEVPITFKLLSLKLTLSVPLSPVIDNVELSPAIVVVRDDDTFDNATSVAYVLSKPANADAFAATSPAILNLAAFAEEDKDVIAEALALIFVSKAPDTFVNCVSDA